MVQSHSMKRRDFIKLSAISPLFLGNYSQAKNTELVFSATCQKCPVGCNINSTNSNNQLNVQNQDSLCIKGYTTFDVNEVSRIKTPLLKNVQGTFDPITWNDAFKILSEKMVIAHKNKGANGVGLCTSGNLGVLESYTLNKFFRAGLRSNNIYNTNHYTVYSSMMASVQVFGNDGVYGNYEDINLSDATLIWGANLAETHPVLFNKILKRRDDNFICFTISTMKNQTSNFATHNLIIKPNSDIYLLKYLMHKYLEENETNLDWELLKKRFIFANLNSQQYTKLDQLEQWEISYKSFKESLALNTLEFTIEKVKASSEDIEQFKIKLELLYNIFNDQTKRVTSLWASGINKQINAIETNTLLYSIHLLTNKHSRPGCGMISLMGQANAILSTLGIGTMPQRLPANMYIKYKKHRDKCENIWHIPDGTINTEAPTNQYNLFENIKNNQTNVLWIMGANPFKSTPQLHEHMNSINANKDLFIVTSDYFMSESAKQSDLVLPTAMPHEKEYISCSNDRMLSYTKQMQTPYENAMSEIWQIVELSRYINIKDVWNLNKNGNDTLLVNVVNQLKNFSLEPNDSLFRTLFANKKAKSFTIKDNIKNSEVKGDERNIITYKDLIFFGYKFYIQKYLYEEMIQFFNGVGYDMPSFETLQNQNIKWPYLFNKSIQYRFNPVDDIYASKAAKYSDRYIFYGKMGGKNLPFGDMNKIISNETKGLKYRAKIFTTNPQELEMQDKKFYLTNMKVLEHINTGTLTNNITTLNHTLNQSYCYMSTKDMQKLKINNYDPILISNDKQKILIRALHDKRFDVEDNMIAIANYGNNILLNNIVESLSNQYVTISIYKGEKNA